MSTFQWRRPVAPWAANYVAARLRRADEREVLASHNASPHQAVMQALEAATVAEAIHTEDGEPAGICGVTSMGDQGRGSMIWMLGTDQLTSTRTHRRLLVVEGRKWVDELLEQGHGPLFNWCLADNQAAIRWLEALGFSFDRPEPYGFGGRLFQHFVRWP